MSDSIKKYFEMLEDGEIFESPDKGKTIYKRPVGGDPLIRELVKSEPEVSEDEWLETFAQISRKYPDASIDLLKAFTNDEIKLKKVCD